MGYTMPGSFILPIGELLVNPTSFQIVVDALPWSPGGTMHSIALPSDPPYLGFMGYFQGGSLDANGVKKLCNSIVVTLQ